MLTRIYKEKCEESFPVFSPKLHPWGAVPVYNTIPAGMATNETWMLRGRKAIPKTPPAGYFRPDDFVPERFGYQEGIPLYRRDQTRHYNPKPAPSLASIMISSSPARTASGTAEWDDGKRPRQGRDPNLAELRQVPEPSQNQRPLSGQETFMAAGAICGRTGSASNLITTVATQVCSWIPCHPR